MRIDELFNKIQKNAVDNKLLVFVNEDSSFLSIQYMSKISKQHNLKKKIVYGLDDLNISRNSFDFMFDSCLQVCLLDKFDCDNSALLNVQNVIIICDSITKNTEKLFADSVVHFPKIEEWQVKEYIQSELGNINKENLQFLCNLCGTDLYKAEIEISRLSIFPESKRNILINSFRYDCIYSDYLETTVFDFINAVLRKDAVKISNLYFNLLQYEKSTYKILKMLYNGVKNVILVQYSNPSSPDICHMKASQYWAVKNNINYYNKNQLFNIFYLLSDIDFKIKSGNIDEKIALDYVLCEIFNKKD